jgi:hypothetical protein
MIRWGLAVLCTMLLIGAPTLMSRADDPTATPTPTSRPTQFSSGCSLPFNPCGALPFSVPQFPTVNLPSPSPIATLPSPTPVPATATPTDTATPTGTLTPTDTPTGATATITAEVQDGGQGLATLSKNMGDMAGTLAAQASQQVVLDGTPSGPAELASKLGEYTGVFFAIVKSYQSMNSFTFGIFAFLLVLLAFTLTIIVTTTIGPIILAFLRLLLQLWQAIKPSWL